MIYIYIFFSIIGLFIIFLFIKAFERANLYFDAMGRVLNARPEKSPFGMVVKGNYKGRDVIFRWILLSKYGPIELKMRHRGTTKKTKMVMLNYPRPTEKTALVGDYVCPVRDLKIMAELYNEEYFIDTLEELTKAAEIVESSAPFYRE